MNDWVRNYIGKPFKSFGRGPDEFDCWGVVHHVYENELNIELPHYAISPACTGAVNNAIDKGVQGPDWRRVEEGEEFDIVIMALDFTKPELNNHIGIYLGSGACLHTVEETGCTIINLSNPMWRSRFRGFYRWQ